MSEKQPYESLPLVEAYYRNEWVKAHHIMNETSKGHLIMDVGTDVAYWVKEIREIKEPTKRPMTHKEIFKAIHEGALIKHDSLERHDNHWGTQCAIDRHLISYDFGETFEPMEVEE